MHGVALEAGDQVAVEVAASSTSKASAMQLIALYPADHSWVELSTFSGSNIYPRTRLACVHSLSHSSFLRSWRHDLVAHTDAPSIHNTDTLNYGAICPLNSPSRLVSSIGENIWRTAEDRPRKEVGRKVQWG